MRKIALAIVAGLLALALMPTAALAVNCGTGTGTCFVTAAGGNWNAGATWSNTDGGATCTCTPATGDHVLITAASGNSTINAAFTLSSVDVNGFTGTLTHNITVTVTISGNDAGAPNGTALRMASGMTLTNASTTSSIWNFTATSGTATVNSNGKTMPGITVNAPGATVTTSGNLAAGALILTAGTFDAANFNISIATFAGSNTNVRALTMGNGAWSVSNSSGATAWTLATITNLTFAANSSTLTFTGNGATNVSFGVLTYNTVAFNAVTNGQSTIVAGNATIGALTSARSLQFTAGMNLTVSTAPTFTGSPSRQILFDTTNIVTGATITVSAGALSASWATFGKITVVGSAGVATDSFDLGGNTNITITAPSGGGGGGRIIGG
jgi:uncharacterized protein YaiE (UPF0345 family)